MSSENNSSAAQVPDIKSYSTIVASFTFIYSFIGACLIIVVSQAFVKVHMHNFRKFSFLLLNTLVTDFLIIFLRVIYAAPCEYYQSQIFGSVGRFIFGVWQSMAFVACLLYNCLISFDRFTTIFKPKFNDKYFTLKNLTVASFFVWILSALWVFVLIVVFQCQLGLIESKMAFVTACPTFIGQKFAQGLSFAGAYAIGTLYVAAITKMYVGQKKIHSQSVAKTMSKRNVRCFWQAFFIWFSIFVNVLTFHIITPLLAGYVLTGALVSVVASLLPSISTSIIVTVLDERIHRTILNKNETTVNTMEPKS